MNEEVERPVGGGPVRLPVISPLEDPVGSSLQTKDDGTVPGAIMKRSISLNPR